MAFSSPRHTKGVHSSPRYHPHHKFSQVQRDLYYPEVIILPHHQPSLRTAFLRPFVKMIQLISPRQNSPIFIYSILFWISESTWLITDPSTTRTRARVEGTHSQKLGYQTCPVRVYDVLDQLSPWNELQLSKFHYFTEQLLGLQMLFLFLSLFLCL